VVGKRINHEKNPSRGETIPEHLQEKRKKVHDKEGTKKGKTNWGKGHQKEETGESKNA